MCYHHRASRHGRGWCQHSSAAVTSNVATGDNSATARLADLYPGLSRAQVPGASAVSLPSI